jgi:hypothetical protein
MTPEAMPLFCEYSLDEMDSTLPAAEERNCEYDPSGFR